MQGSAAAGYPVEVRFCLVGSGDRKYNSACLHDPACYARMNKDPMRDPYPSNLYSLALETLGMRMRSAEGWAKRTDWQVGVEGSRGVAGCSELWALRDCQGKRSRIWTRGESEDEELGIGGNSPGSQRGSLRCLEWSYYCGAEAWSPVGHVEQEFQDCNWIMQRGRQLGDFI